MTQREAEASGSAGGSWKKRVWQGAKLAVGLAMIVWLAYYLVRHSDQLRSLYDASWTRLAATGLAVALTWVLMSAQGYLLLRGLGVRIGFFEHTALQFASILVNYLPIRLGPVLRIHYLRKVHAVPLADFGSLLMVRAVLLMAACGVLGLVGSVLLTFEGRRPDLELWLLFAGLIVGTLVLGLLPLRRLFVEGFSLPGPLVKLIDGIDRLRTNPRLIAALIGLLLAQLGVVALRLHWTYGAVQLEASVATVITVAAVAALVNLLALTMGSLGVREAAIGWATAAVGFDFSQGVFAGLVDRAVLIVLAYVLGGLGLLWVRSRLKRFEDGDAD